MRFRLALRISLLKNQKEIIRIFFNRLLLEQVQVNSNSEQKVLSSHITPAPTHMRSLSHYQHPTRVGHLSTTDEPALTHHNHPGSIVDLRVHSGGRTFYIQACTMCMVSYRIVSLFCSPLFIPLASHLLATTDLFTVPIALPFPEEHLIGVITQYVTFSDQPFYIVIYI